MNNEKHAPEPWSVVEAVGSVRLRGLSYEHKAEDDCIVDADGVEVLGSSERLRGTEHLRRIIACVNACAGISNEDLEAVVSIGEKKYLQELRDERDGLLTLLSTLLTASIKLKDEMDAAWKAGLIAADAIPGETVRAFHAAVAELEGEKKHERI